MRIILIVIVVVCCVYIGFAINNYFYKRERFFSNLLLFLQKLLNNILFNNEKLNIILKNIELEIFNDDFNFFIKEYFSFLNDDIDFIKFRKNIIKTFYYLNEFERTRFLEFVYNLGSQTKEEETKKINNYKTEVIILKEESVNKKRVYASLYLKLFILLGFLFFIIFI